MGLEMWAAVSTGTEGKKVGMPGGAGRMGTGNRKTNSVQTGEDIKEVPLSRKWGCSQVTSSRESLQRSQ